MEGRVFGLHLNPPQPHNLSKLKGKYPILSFLESVTLLRCFLLSLESRLEPFRKPFGETFTCTPRPRESSKERRPSPRSLCLYSLYWKTCGLCMMPSWLEGDVTVMIYNRSLHGFRCHLGCGQSLQKLQQIHVWDIAQLSTLGGVLPIFG